MWIGFRFWHGAAKSDGEVINVAMIIGNVGDFIVFIVQS